MPAKKKFNYREVYLFCKEQGRENAIEYFGISPTLARYIVAIGDGILENKPIPREARTIDKYSPPRAYARVSKTGI